MEKNVKNIATIAGAAAAVTSVGMVNHAHAATTTTQTVQQVKTVKTNSAKVAEAKQHVADAQTEVTNATQNVNNSNQLVNKAKSDISDAQAKIAASQANAGSSADIKKVDGMISNQTKRVDTDKQNIANDKNNVAEENKANNTAMNAVSQAQTDLNRDRQKEMVDNNSLKVAYDNLVKYNTAAAMAQHAIDQDKADGNVAQLQKDEAAYNTAVANAKKEQVTITTLNNAIANDKQQEAADQQALSTAENMSKQAAANLQSARAAYDEAIKANRTAMNALQHAQDVLNVDRQKAVVDANTFKNAQNAYNSADEDAHAQQVAMQEIKKSLAQDKIDIANAEKNLSTAVNLSHKTAEELQHAETILGKDEQELQTDQATLDKLKETLNKMNSANDDLDQAEQDLQNAQKELDSALNQNNIDKIALQKAEAELQALEDTTITTVTNTRELGNSFTLTTPSSTTASTVNTAATNKMMNNANAEAATINDGAKKMPTRAEYRASLPTTGDNNNEEASVFGAIAVAISGLIANFGLARKKREN